MAQNGRRHAGETPALQTRITYEVEVNGCLETRELPFVLGVLADLSGTPAEPLPPFAQREFAEVDRDNFNYFMSGVRPRLSLIVPNMLAVDGSKMGIELRFLTPDDFEPDQLVAQIEPLRKLVDARERLSSLLTHTERNPEMRKRLHEALDNPELFFRKELALGPTEDSKPANGKEPASMSMVPGPRRGQEVRLTEEASDVFAHIFPQPDAEATEEQRYRFKEQIATFVEEVKQGELVISSDFGTAVNARIAEIDRLVSKQLNEILHTPDFQRLEATWRGVYKLVHHSETSGLLKVRVCNVSKGDLIKDFETSAVRQSVLFQKVYEDALGSFGGAPYGALIGDYEFKNHPQDLRLLRRISHVAAAAHAPFISAASPELFNATNFGELSSSHDLSTTFKAVEFALWRSVQGSEDARYLGLVVPRVLMRQPYGRDTYTADSFRFEEDVDGADSSKYLWGSAVYSFGCCLTQAFAKHYWCGGLIGPEGGGLVHRLVTHRYFSDDGCRHVKGPTEIAVTDRLEQELASLGFVPLVHCRDKDYAAFFSMQSCYKAAKLNSFEVANIDAPLPTQLPFVFATSRFLHYLKAIVRDKVGAFRNAKDCEDYLNRWISSYVLLDEAASPEAQAEKPLREARIEVSEIAGKARTYKAKVFLQPHFQLDQRTSPALAELSTHGIEDTADWH